MSDLMLHGTLNMPLPDDPSELDLVTWVQFRDRAREASARIRELEVHVGRVTVKPLEWWDARFCNSPREEANSLLGHYEVLQWLHGDFGGSVPSEDPEQSGTEFGGASSMEEAKAAAQSDYERRIMSALTFAPVTVSEAARVLIERIPCDEDAIAKVQHYARFADFLDALRAIQEQNNE